MKRKLLTERQAWLLGAEEWAKAEKIDDHYWVRNARGLCSWIDYVRDTGLIGPRVHHLMYVKIRDAGNRNLFYWSTHTPAGRNARVRFCLKQAKLLEKPKKKARKT